MIPVARDEKKASSDLEAAVRCDDVNTSRQNGNRRNQAKPEVAHRRLGGSAAAKGEPVEQSLEELHERSESHDCRFNRY